MHQHDFTGLAYGTYMISIQAFPNADGSGVAQATGGGSMVVTEDAPGALGGDGLHRGEPCDLARESGDE